MLYTMFYSLKSVVTKHVTIDKSGKAVKGFDVAHNRIDYKHCYNDNLFRYS